MYPKFEQHALEDIYYFENGKSYFTLQGEFSQVSESRSVHPNTAFSAQPNLFSVALENNTTGSLGVLPNCYLRDQQTSLLF